MAWLLCLTRNFSLILIGYLLISTISICEEAPLTWNRELSSTTMHGDHRLVGCEWQRRSYRFLAHPLFYLRPISCDNSKAGRKTYILACSFYPSCFFSLIKQILRTRYCATCWGKSLGKKLPRELSVCRTVGQWWRGHSKFLKAYQILWFCIWGT